MPQIQLAPGCCKVKVIDSTGKSSWVPLKKGTQVVDGLWPEMRESIPDSVHTSDWPRCQDYIWSWVWRMRRPGLCLMTEFGNGLREIRSSAG